MILKNKKVAVLGGAGLIGSYLVELLVIKGYKVVVIDDFSKGKRGNLKNVEKKIDIKVVNLENHKNLYKILKGCKIIFHLASRAYGIGYSKNNHSKILEHNEKITNNIIASLSKIKIDYFQCVSSSCVYDDNGPIRISEEINPIGIPEKANLGYGQAKRLLEEKLTICSSIFKFPLSIVRPFNIYSERYNWLGGNSQAIPMIVKKVMESKRTIEIWGSGKQKRNYLHAKDCAEIMFKIFKKKYTKTPINIGYENTVSLGQLTKKICNQAKKKPQIIYDLSKPEGRFVKSSNSKLLKKVTSNYKPKINLEKGLALMIKWYEKNFK
jgi:UDP-glucose 4-epimerase